MFRFFADAPNLERITPKFLSFEILTPGPIEMRAGTLIDYKMGLYGARFTWHTRIEEYEPPEFFVDVQLSGPYRKWRHRHEFEDAPGGTLMRDRVDYEIGFGPLGRVAHAVFVRRSLNNIFDYRNRTILEILG